MRGRVSRPAGRPIPASATWRRPGGFTFAEDPAIIAPDARILWTSDFDPGILRVRAVSADADDPDAIDPAILGPWLTSVIDSDGHEHAVFSDGFRRVRLDLDRDRLSGRGPVVLRYLIEGRVSAERRVLPLRRLLHLFRHRGFSPAMFPYDHVVVRGIQLLRVHDLLREGASQRQLAELIVGTDRTAAEWRASSDSLRSRIRRMVRDARMFAVGGCRSLMRRHR